ncbi:MAG: septation protein IspZ, partial [Ghiorsea sp.]
MKMLIDFLPVALFFIVYKMEDIYVATAVLI